MNRVYTVLFFMVLVMSQSARGGSASFEVWSDNGNLTKLSTPTTDSVTFELQGTTAIIRCEIRETFNGRPTRRLQLTLPNFTGVKTYDVNTTSTFWENFSLNKKCECTNSLSNNFVIVTEYDSAKKNIKGTFEFRCLSQDNSGGDLKYRIRNGSFDAGQPKIALDLLPKDTVKLRLVTQDTVIGIRIKTLDAQGQPLEGVNIYVNDHFATNTNNYTLANTSNSNGVYVYTTTIPSTTPSGEYTIKVCASKNGMKASDTSTVLYRYGKRYFDYKCGGLTVLSFDAGAGKEWQETSGSPIIKATGPVTIGEVLKMDGETRIDTTTGAIRVFMGGRLYYPNVHFADDDISDFEITLPTGSDFPLPDCDGIMKLATKRLLTKKLPGGIALTLSEFKIVNRPDAMGLKLGAEIEIATAKVGCSDPGDLDSQKAEISITVTSSGFESLEFKASKISLTPVVCLKELVVNADWVAKQYYLGGKGEFPLGPGKLEVEAGGLFKNNPNNPDGKIHLDSAHFSLIGDSALCKLIPDTPLCFAGIKLSASGLSGPTLQGAAWRGGIIVRSAEQAILGNPKFSWLINKLGKPAIAELEGTIQYQHPLIFTGTINAHLAKVALISEEKPWQVEGMLSSTLDLNSNIALNGSYKAGHLGADDYAINATGNLTLQWVPNLGISATATGAIRIPAPGGDVIDDHPFVGAALQFMQLSGLIPQNLGSGTAVVSVTENDGFLLSTDVDVSQNPVDYIRSFGRMTMKLTYNNHLEFTTAVTTVPPSRAHRSDIGIQSISPVSSTLKAVALDTIEVDDTIERLFVMVSGKTNAPVSTIIDPTGKSYTAADATNGVLRFSTPNGEMVQWTLVNPAVGKWILSLTNPSASDSVDITANRKQVPFAITAAQNSSQITMTWPNRTSSSTDEVRFFLDVDSAGFNGTFIGSAKSNDGTFSYTIPSSLKECRYYVYAIRLAKGMSTSMAYAAKTISANGSGIATPMNISAISDVRGRTTVRWTRPNDPSITGYAINVVDENGRDSLYALLYSFEEAATLTINNQTTKKIYMTAFNAKAERSCRSEAAAIVTSVEDYDESRLPDRNEPVVIVPHPVLSQASIRFTTTDVVDPTIQIHSLDGRLITQLLVRPINREVSEAVWNTDGVQNGIYLVHIQTARGVQLSRIVVMH